MKEKSLIILLSLITLGISAQSFEGIIHFRMSTVITDPEKKAEMEVVTEAMTPEKLAATIREIEKQRETPEMKKMLAENPEVKATLDKQLDQLKAMQARLAEGGPEAGLSGAMEIVMSVKGHNVLTKIEGALGAMTGDILYRGEEEKTYEIFPERQTYSEMEDFEEEETTDTEEWEVIPTSDYQTFLGYRCRKYELQISGETDRTGVIWATNDLKLPNGIWKDSDIDMNALTKIDGLPMRMELEMEENEGTLVIEVTELKKMSLPDSTFEIPKGFRKE